MASIHNWHAEETYRSLTQYGSTALRFVLLVNGGAIVALLTFVGDLQGKTSSVPDMTWPFILFMTGILFGGCATVTSYLTQLTLYNESINNLPPGYKHHTFWLRWSLGLISLGIIIFGIGALVAVIKLR